MNFMLASIKKAKDLYKAPSGKEDVRKEIKDEVIEMALRENFSDRVRLANAYMDEVVTAVKRLNIRGVDVRAVVSTKLLVGTASGFLKVITEVGMHWDPVLDLPYVPGSSIKGILRSNALELCKEKKSEECVKYVLKLFGSGETFAEAEEVFGFKGFTTEAHVGKVVVTNAYPTELSEGKLFAGDIVNPHYYRDNKVVENEYEVEPRPVRSLVIRKGVRFRFVIGVKELEDAKKLSKLLFNHDLKKPSELVLLLLTYSFSKGIGAKSSRGYGYMDVEVVNLW